MAQRTCTMPGCGKPYRAQGMCSTHYNVANAKQVEMVCAACGRTVVKSSERNKSRHRAVCSYVCRKYLQFAKAMCPVPDRHPSRSTLIPPEHLSRSPLACAVPLDHLSRVPLCNWCGEMHNRSRFCSRRCLDKAKAMRRRANESDGRTYSWTQVMRVFLLLGGRCAYCEQVPDGPPDPDHVIPISRHGSNGDGNILPACRPCNSDKRDLLLHEWAEDRARRGKPPVRTVLDRSLPAFAHLLPDVINSGRPTHAHAA